MVFNNSGSNYDSREHRVLVIRILISDYCPCFPKKNLAGYFLFTWLNKQLEEEGKVISHCVAFFIGPRIETILMIFKVISKFVCLRDQLFSG
jgi:hypothetical protein